MLSALQVEDSSSKEIDVNGECATTIKIENGNIIKSKKLSECKNRAMNEIGIQTASIKTESSLKPLDSSIKCQYVMHNAMVNSVRCHEQHIFKPFSAGYKSPSGAMTIVKQNLTLLVMSNPSTKVKMIRDGK